MTVADLSSGHLTSRQAAPEGRRDPVRPGEARESPKNDGNCTEVVKSREDLEENYCEQSCEQDVISAVQSAYPVVTQAWR